MAVKGVTSTTDKATRLIIVTPMMEAKNVVIPQDASWLPEFEKELALFPFGKHDDQVNISSQYLGCTPVQSLD